MTAFCPECKTSPNNQQMWKCFCGVSFDHFNNIGKCPSCGYNHEFTECLNLNCKTISLHLDWYPKVNESLINLKFSLHLVSS